MSLRAYGVIVIGLGAAACGFPPLSAIDDAGGHDGAGGDAPPPDAWLADDGGLLLDCPAPGDVPPVERFAPVALAGENVLHGAASAWSWTITGGPCDQLFATHTGNPSKQTYSLTGATTQGATAAFTIPGDYVVTMTATTAQGPATCSWVQHVNAKGLSVELCWDQQGTGDLDVHLHEPGDTSAWFNTTADCFYSNCGAGAGVMRPNWGFAPTALAACDGGPNRQIWETNGQCGNPRLEWDNINAIGVPEYSAIDDPADGQTFRVMVHYYGGTVVEHPVVDLYCDGSLAAVYGDALDVPGFTMGGTNAMGPMWRVADVTTHVSGGVTTCTVAALHPNGMTTGYFVTNNDTSY